jgi:hypothetical protein
MFPRLMVFTTSGFTSTPVTLIPLLAAAAAVGRPMYPKPINTTFMI